MLSMWLATVFLTSKISYLQFPSLTHRTETGSRKGGKLLPNNNPPGPIKQSSQSIAGVGFAVHFANLSILWKNAGPKPFCWAKPACFAFSSSKICCAEHITYIYVYVCTLSLNIVAHVMQVSFFRQFGISVTKEDYNCLRLGFIAVSIATNPPL